MTVQLTEEKKEELSSVIEKVMRDTQARGMSVSLIKKDGTKLYQRFFGYRDEKKKTEIDEDTIFGIASITKSFTALSIMQMQEKRLLTLEDAFGRYIRYFSNHDRPFVRLRHLLSHSGGYYPLPRILLSEVASEFDLEDSPENDFVTNPILAEDGARRIAERLDHQTEFIGDPGEYMSYSNDGFCLLSDIIRRKAQEESYEEYVQNHILKPLHMTRSGCSFVKAAGDANVATLYSLEKGEWRADLDFYNDAFVLNGGGNMKSTTGDMLSYLRMYLNGGLSQDGIRIALESSVREMEHPRAAVSPEISCGYGLMQKLLKGYRIIEHGGSLPGVSSHLAYSHDLGIGILILCNTMEIPVNYLSDCAFRAFLGEQTEEEAPPPRELSWSKEDLLARCGEYISGEGDSFVISEKQGIPEMEVNGEETEMIPVAADRGIVRKKYMDINLEFLHDEARGTYAARYGSRIFPKKR